MLFLIAILVLVPFGLVISLFASEKIGLAFQNHGTRSSLVFASIATLTRILLFMGVIPSQIIYPNRSAGADLVQLMMFPDALALLPLEGIRKGIGGQVPIPIFILYWMILYFFLYRYTARVSAWCGQYESNDE